MAEGKDREIWDQKHIASGFRYNRVTSFAESMYKNFLVGMGGKLLELGCGKGADSIFFHEKGFKVTAVDFSKNAISIFNEVQKQKGIFITTLVMDITEPFLFEDASFDAIYSRISLNYFTHAKTKSMFSEISRVLKSEGYLLFQVKSVKDKDYGKGTKIEDDVYEEQPGYARHFFSKDYTISLLSEDFHIDYIEEDTVENGSSYLNVVARKK